jgi:hypothetical protein
MKSVCCKLFLVALSLSSLAFSQADAKKSFDQLKTLAGTWQAQVSTTPVKGGMEGMTMQVTLRPTSMGNAIMHEMKGAGRPDDPITMLYLENDTLILTHYCDAGNRPRMVGKLSADGKTVQFDLLDVAGSTQYGHMQSATFTFVDADHHIEDWVYMQPGDKPVRAHFDLHKTTTPAL